MFRNILHVSHRKQDHNERTKDLLSQIVQNLLGGVAVKNWQCLCGNLVFEKRFCPRCKLVRFRLDRPVVLDYYDLRVGTVKGGLPFNLPLNRLSQHVLISGQTGTGKSRFAMRLATRAENHTSQQGKIKLLIIDVEGEWKRIIPDLKEKTYYYDVAKNLRINPFDLNDPALIRELFKETVFKGIEKEYSDLSAQMNFVLNYSIKNSTNMMELIENIKRYDGYKLNAVEKTKTALLVRLELFSNSPLKEIFLCKKSSIDFERIDENNIIVDLHSLDAKVAYNTELRLIYNVITTYYLRAMLNRGTESSVSNIFLADEAQLLVPKILHKMIVTESWTATEFATRLRKRGCGLILITQSPSNIELDIFKNTGTKISFRLQSWDDIKLISYSCGFVDTTEQQYLSDKFVRLSNREAIVCMNNQEPFLITADNYTLQDFEPCAKKLENYCNKPLISEEKSLDPNESDFVDSIETNPFVSTRDRRSLLKWNSKKYSEIVDMLIHKRKIEKIKISLGRGTPLVLYQKPNTIPSVKHQYYIDWIVTRLQDKGFETIINTKKGADIVIPKIKTAIEIETGNSAIMANVVRDCHQFDLVIVATDCKKVLESVSKQKEARNVLCCKIQDVPAVVSQKKH